MTPAMRSSKTQNDEELETSSKTRRTQSAGSGDAMKQNATNARSVGNVIKKNNAVEVSNPTTVIDAKEQQEDTEGKGDQASVKEHQEDTEVKKNQTSVKFETHLPVNNEGNQHDKLIKVQPEIELSKRPAKTNMAKVFTDAFKTGKSKSSSISPSQGTITKLISSQFKVFAPNAMDTVPDHQSESWVDATTVSDTCLSDEGEPESPTRETECEEEDTWEFFTEMQPSTFDVMIRKQVVHLRRENLLLRSQLSEAVDWEVQVMKAYTTLVEKHQKTRRLLERVHAELQKEGPPNTLAPGITKQSSSSYEIHAWHDAKDEETNNSTDSRTFKSKIIIK
ncbi:uncharacterized protein [Amphiura filiformis]|uniref:uncharacterized protein n=1 Tax=Amphiura filiformis TaxID=82378 RepID=UPI003B20CC05